MYKNLLCAVILGLDLANCYKLGIDWYDLEQMYLQKDHKSLTYCINTYQKIMMQSSQLTIAIIPTKSTSLDFVKLLLLLIYQ